jgi:hypothetical protein
MNKMMMQIKLLILIGFFIFSNINKNSAQDIKYQKFGDEITTYTVGDSNNNYRVNTGYTTMSISKFDKNMAFQDIIVLYVEKGFVFKDQKGKKWEIGSFVGFKDVVISKNKIHLLFENTHSKNKVKYIHDLQIDLATFEVDNEFQELFRIESKRSVNFRFINSTYIPHISYKDSVFKMFYQIPNKYADNCVFGLIDFKIEDDITIKEKNTFNLFPGLKRDFFSIIDVEIDRHNNIILKGDKTIQSDLKSASTMYFFKKKDSDKFEKLTLSLDNREIETSKIYLYNNEAFIYGLAKKQNNNNIKNSKLSSIQKNDEGQYETYVTYYKKDNFKDPIIKYFDSNTTKYKVTDVLDSDQNNPKEIELEFQRRLNKIIFKEDNFYLVFHYIHYPNNPTYYSYGYVPKPYYYKDFEIHKLNSSLNDEWISTINHTASFKNSFYSNFVGCSVLYKNDDFYLVYNDSYNNSNKDIKDKDLSILNFNAKLPNNDLSEVFNLESRNIKLESKEISDVASIAYTLTLVKVNTDNGELEKVKYQQRMLTSLIHSMKLNRLYDNSSETYYFPYYIYKNYGICSININSL